MTNIEAKDKLYMEWQKYLENYIDYAGVSEAYKVAFKSLDKDINLDKIKSEVLEYLYHHTHEIMYMTDIDIAAAISAIFDKYINGNKVESEE